MICRNCGEQMYGDGYKVVISCPNISESQQSEVEFMEPDADPVYCEEELPCSTQL